MRFLRRLRHGRNRVKEREGSCISGNKIGGLKAKQKNLARDPDFYANIGKIGGLKGKADGTIKGFARMPKWKVSEAGKTGGMRSRRGPISKDLKDRTKPLNPQEFDSVIPKRRFRLW